MNYTKQVTLTGAMVACSFSLAWAEDVPVDIYAEAVETQGSVQVETYQAAETNSQPQVAIPQKSPMVTQAPKLSRQDNAILHLSMIRDEVASMEESGFLGGLFSSGTELQATLLQDIDIFLATYHDLEIASEALYLRGVIQFKQGHYEQTAVTWLQTAYEYPNTDAALNAEKKLKDLVGSDWEKHADQTLAILNNVGTGNIPTRLSKLISQLYPIDDKEVTKPLVLLQVDFLKRFSDDTHADEVQVLLAHSLGVESPESGIFGFKKFLSLFPHSSYRPEAMLAIGDLQRLRLKNYEKAVQNYAKLIEDYPNHSLTIHAHENLATTYETHLKLYYEALAAFETIVQKYPEDKLALTALQHIATLQEKKTSQVPEAVVTLRKLATMFHGDEAVEALETAIKIADRKLKDAALVLEIQNQLIKDYPDSDAAPAAMYDMAETAEKNGQGKDLYQKFIDKYPDHKYAKKAQKKLTE